MRPSVASGLPDMLRQSAEVLSRPSVATFERYERAGNLTSAYTYVGVAALVGAVIAGFFALFYAGLSPLAQFVTRFLAVVLGFALFTGAVYLIGRAGFRGTGTYPEVAYTFALFYVPLSIVGTLIGVIPIIGWLVGLVIAIANVFFGWLSVQSSMNIRDAGRAAITLVLSGLAYWLLVNVGLGALFSALFAPGTYR